MSTASDVAPLPFRRMGGGLCTCRCSDAQVSEMGEA
ncbi:hypothetical protein A2U01_0119429, partial [Trifolium medium]|nr:hypothetical protein [Trifolium medium]